MIESALRETIVIRPLDIWRAGAMYDFVAKNRDYFLDTIPFVSGIHTKKDIVELIKTNLEKQAKKEGLYYTLWDKEKNTMMGYLSAREIEEGAKWAEIGYMIDEEYAGKGITKAACIRLIDYLFDTLGMEKIALCCNDDNEGSKAIAKRLGFSLEGKLRRHHVVNGKVRNTLYYGLLKEEYRS